MTITRTGLTIKCRKVLNILNEVVVMQAQDKGHHRRHCGWVSHCILPVTICNLEGGNADEGGKSPYNTSNTSILEGGARGSGSCRSGNGNGDSDIICGGRSVSMGRTRR